MTKALDRARVAAVKTARQYAPRKQRNARPTLWEHGEFVAIDGEGFSDGEPFDVTVGVNETRYTGRHHNYAYLAASDGSECYSDNRLGSVQCLEFVCSIAVRNPRAILVAFGASYDVTHMVARDFDRSDLVRLIGKSPDHKSCIVTTGGWTYKLDYRPRKCLTIQRWPEGARRWTTDNKGRRILTPHLTVRLWDVWGFFQDTFVGVIEKWCPGDPDYQFVKRMKGERKTFERSEIEDIRRYNAAELRLLVKIMNRVRDAINDLGLKITRWDGAGAVAAAMMTKHKVKVHKNETPQDVFEAARRAYSGGHIEACKIGYYSGRVFHYDINSAYPDQFRVLPSLRMGRWIAGTGTPRIGYCIVKVEFAFPNGLPFYPLFYRNEDGSIFYPPSGVGWYWHSEFSVAQKANPIKWNVQAWFHFEPADEERPFGWVEDYYASRQRYISAAKLGGFESGPEMIIKLGLNALYGKTAQQVGARIDADGELRLPPFFQLDWAGYVTAGCRARMMEAALQKPDAVIMFATDGLFTTEPLDLYCPAEKELGAWEAKEHDGITVVMPGVYWLHDGETKKHYSRGFDKAEMKDDEFIRDAWKRGADSVPIKLSRLVGIGSACSSKQLWPLRGNFAESRRVLALDGDTSKRYPLAPGRKPHLQLCPLEPRDHFLPNKLGIAESSPYPISWLDGTPPPRDEPEMMEWLDEIDAELI